MIKVIIAILFLLSGFFIYKATIESSSKVYLASELVEVEQDIKRMRIAARVSDKEIIYESDPELKLSFYISHPNEEQNIPVIFIGLKPDMFAAGRDVIIDGDYINKTIYASKLLTQCPSKYEAAIPTSNE